MKLNDLDKYGSYVAGKIRKKMQEVSSDGSLCKLVALGTYKVPYVLSIDTHSFGRIKERLDIQNRTIFLGEIASLIESNQILGNMLDADVDNIANGETFHKTCLLYEELDWFIYLHIFADNHIKIGTVVTREPIYFVDPSATAILLKRNREIVTGVKNISCFEFSNNTKYNKTHKIMA